MTRSARPTLLLPCVLVALGCRTGAAVPGAAPRPAESATTAAAPACAVLTLGLAAPSIAGRPATARSGDRVAVAWLARGDRSFIHLALVDEAGGELRATVEQDLATGWTGLSAPRLAPDGAGGFLLAFGGRDLAGREGLAIARVSEPGADPPTLALLAAGGPRPLAIQPAPGPTGERTRVLLGWSAWEVDSPRVTLSHADPAAPAIAALGIDLGPAPPDPAMQLDSPPRSPTPRAGAAPPWVRALWAGFDGPGAAAGRVVRGAILDPARPMVVDPFTVSDCATPSLAALEGADLVLCEQRGRLALARVATASAPATTGPRARQATRVPTARSPELLPPPDGAAGVLARLGAAALLCTGQPGEIYSGLELGCRMHDGSGAPRGDRLAIAVGEVTPRSLDLATGDDGRAVLVWSQDDPSSGSAVALASLRCR